MTTEKAKDSPAQPNPIVAKAAEAITRPTPESPQLALFPLSALTPRAKRKTR